MLPDPRLQCYQFYKYWVKEKNVFVGSTFNNQVWIDSFAQIWIFFSFRSES